MTKLFGTTLCVFVKVPRSGAVKTRLSPAITASQAATLSQAFFSDTLALACTCSWARVIVACDGDPRSLALPPRIPVWNQGSGDLGKRLERILSHALEESHAAIVIGTDSPGLPRRLLDEAYQQLATHQAVMGPADDGGFYLMGLTTCPEGLLYNLTWSTEQTYERTVARLNKHELTFAKLDPWFDVDSPTDLDRLRDLIDKGKIDCPNTARALACSTFGITA